MKRTTLTLAALLTAACGNREIVAPKATKPEPARVRVLQVQAQAFTPRLSVTGTLASRSVVELKAETTGRVLRFDKEEGDRVAAGEVLIFVDEAKRRLAVREAETVVEVARAVAARAQVNKAYAATELERANNLVTSGGITDKDLKSARVASQDADAQLALTQAQLAQAQASLATARQLLDECQVRAPVSGVISRKLVNKGAYVEPATPVLVLVDNNRLELESPVAASDLGAVRPGQAVRFAVNSYPNESFAGRVVDLSPSVDADSRTAKVRIHAPNPSGRLKSGMFAQGEIVTGATLQAVLVPLAAVYRDDSAAKTSYVYVVSNNKAQRRQVQIGREIDGSLEITAGLNPGDLLIPERSIELADGVDVSLQKQ